MILHWGFFKDAWLIDKVPDIFPITFEEHPKGWRINPSKVTFYFGANPTYLWGEGKLYHEVLFGNLGFVFLPFFYGRPGLEFIESYKVTFVDDKDWVGNSAGIYKIGRVNIDDMIKSYIQKYYDVDPNKKFQPGDLSSKLVKATGDEIKSQFQTEYNAIFKTISDMRNNLNCIWYSSFHSHNEEIIELTSNKEIPVITPFDTYYFVQAIYKNVLSFKDCRVDITKPLKVIFYEKDSNECFITFKTPTGFIEGVVIDYGYDDKSGFRLDIVKEGVDIYVNGKKYHYAKNLIFNTNNSFVIYIKFDSEVMIRINKDTTIRTKDKIPKPTIKDSDIAYISSFSKSNKYVETGNFEEFGIFKSFPNPDYIDRFLEFDPFLPFIQQDQKKEIPIVLENLTFSCPASILIPNGFTSKEDGNKKTIPFNKVYLEDQNSNIEVATYSKVKNKDAVELNIPKNFNVYKVLGNEDKYFDDKTENCYMIKKISTDTHIPIKIDIEFKIPEWWNKEMELKMELRLVPIGRMLWYHYKRFKTGDWS